jgi:hypothetical protein
MGSGTINYGAKAVLYPYAERFEVNITSILELAEVLFYEKRR